LTINLNYETIDNVPRGTQQKKRSKNKMNIDFKKTVNTKKVNKLSLAQLTALNNLLDGKATKKDYKILKNAK